MKKFIKALIPNSIIRHYKARDLYKSYYYDAVKYIKYSNTYYKNDSKEKLRADIIKRYHVVEKGLTMPERRFSFGREVIMVLIQECNDFKNRYGTDELQVRQAVMILYEYLKVHQDNSVELDEELKSKILRLIKAYQIDTATVQGHSDPETYFSKKDGDFAEFAKSRYSVRNYSDKDVPVQLFDSVISLALHAPSACNRQPSRVFLVSDKEKIKAVLAVQNGNRGFGHLANKLLIVTVDLSGFIGLIERNLAWIDGGIFSMNLLYALHYYGIGACPLNWAVEPEKDRKLHKICDIPENHRIVLVVSCGYPKEEFNHPLSLRYNTDTCFKCV